MNKKYDIDDLKFFFEAKTLFYEIGADGQPVKHKGIFGDEKGDLLHVGQRDGDYVICYYVNDSSVGKFEECIAGQNFLLKNLNNEIIRPVDFENDTEDIFLSLDESIKKILKEEIISSKKKK